MKSISGGRSGRLLITFAIKASLSTLFFVGVFSLITSWILVRLDINLNIIGALSVVICAFSAFLISVISVRGFRNNGAVMGIISSLPLIFYSLINALFNENTMLLFVIKLALILVLSALGGALSVKRGSAVKI